VSDGGHKLTELGSRANAFGIDRTTITVAVKRSAKLPMLLFMVCFQYTLLGSCSRARAKYLLRPTSSERFRALQDRRFVAFAHLQPYAVERAASPAMG
jgi:hypothetical protein